jgi:hypothetical protein
VILGVLLVGQEPQRFYYVEDMFLVSVKSKQAIPLTPNLYRMGKRNNEFCIVRSALVVRAPDNAAFVSFDVDWLYPRVRTERLQFVCSRSSTDLLWTVSLGRIELNLAVRPAKVCPVGILRGGLPVSWMAERNVKFVVRVFFPIARHARSREGCESCQDSGQP